MSKFILNSENVQFIAQAFETNSTNAKSIIRSKYPITDDDYNQIYANYDFDKFKSFLLAKKKVSRFLKDRKLLKLSGVSIDNENKSISYPFKVVKSEHIESINNLRSISFSFQQATFLL